MYALICSTSPGFSIKIVLTSLPSILRCVWWRPGRLDKGALRECEVSLLQCIRLGQFLSPYSSAECYSLASFLCIASLTLCLSFVWDCGIVLMGHPIGTFQFRPELCTSSALLPPLSGSASIPVSLTASVVSIVVWEFFVSMRCYVSSLSGSTRSTSTKLVFDSLSAAKSSCQMSFSPFCTIPVFLFFNHSFLLWNRTCKECITRLVLGRWT